MRKIATNLETQKRNASRSLPVTVHRTGIELYTSLMTFKTFSIMIASYDYNKVLKI
jgi:hypothetical protein